MKTQKTQYVCGQCGYAYSKWMGRCQQCGQWNTVSEERIAVSVKKNRLQGSDSVQPPQTICSVQAESIDRIPSFCGELDTVLGGGLVPGSVVLLGGEPGIGKSTLLLQAAADYGKRGLKVLYASGEESPSQIALRASRLKVESDNVWVVSETCLEQIQIWIDKISPDLLIIDSIQTVFSRELDSQPGSVAQLRECTHELISLAKGSNLPTFLVGHVTKEGAIAGPKILEHMVDVVLYFEGTSNHTFRLLRSIKNRFGSTNEVGVFEMSGKGIHEVKNPSELFLSERTTILPGSVITSSLEGSRPFLVEIQALVSKSPLTMPRRTAIGIDHNRVSLLVAILEKRAGFRFFDQDVYLNIAGGLKLNEPAVDLAVIAAIVSSYTGKAAESKSIFFGEVGLGGEIRSVPRSDTRLKEAQRIGFERAFVPSRVAKDLKNERLGIELISLEHVGALTDYV